MKKTYIAPELAIHRIETQNIIALSLLSDKADGSDALVKGNDWDVWGEEDNVNFWTGEED